MGFESLTPMFAIPVPELPFVKMPFPQNMANIAVWSNNVKYSFSQAMIGPQISEGLERAAMINKKIIKK